LKLNLNLLQHLTVQTGRHGLGLISRGFSPETGRYNGRMPPVPLAAPPSIGVQQRVFDNGLRVVVQPIHTAPLVSIWTWYHVGSKDEGPGRTGVSHWVEHMNFKGSARIPRDEMKTFVDKVGGTWNGYTWIDETAYFETASRDALDRMLFLEAERMASCTYDPHECESERTVIISELHGSENDPEQLLDVELTAAAFRAHPYGHPTLGWLTDLETMTRDDLFGHYRLYYTPENAHLVIAGDVDPDVAFNAAEREFGKIVDGRAGRRVTTVEPPQQGERRVTVERPGTTSYLKVAWRSPSINDPDFLPLVIADAALTGAKGLNLWSSFRLAPPQRKARLYRALVDGGLASAVSGGILPTEHPFLYTISATIAEGVSGERVEEALFNEISRLRREGLQPGELQRAKRQLRARLVFENDSVTSIAHQLGYYSTIASLDVFLSLEERIAAVTEAQVFEAVSRRLADSQRTVGWFRPTEAA
jgi:zinc protease